MHAEHVADPDRVRHTEPRPEHRAPPGPVCATRKPDDLLHARPQHKLVVLDGDAHQQRNRDAPDQDDFELNVLSLFGVWVPSDRLAVLARYDRMFDPNPFGPSIAYLPMSPDAPSNLVILGLDVTIVKQFHIIPTFDTVIYDAVGDEEAPDTDFVPRLTFSVAF